VSTVTLPHDWPERPSVPTAPCLRRQASGNRLFSVKRLCVR